MGNTLYWKTIPLEPIEEGIDADINREEFISNTRSENEDILHFDEQGNLIKSFKHNSLWDARVIRQCFFKLQN